MIGKKVGPATVERELRASPLGTTWFARNEENGQPVIVTVVQFPPGSKDRLLSTVQEATTKYLQAKSTAISRLYSVRLKGNEIYLIHAFAEGVPILQASSSLAQPRSAEHFHRLVNQLAPLGHALDQLRATNLQYQLLSPWSIWIDVNNLAFLPYLSPIGEIPELIRAVLANNPHLRAFSSGGGWPDMFGLARTIQCLIEPRLTDRYALPDTNAFVPIRWLDEAANAVLAQASEPNPTLSSCSQLLAALQQTSTYRDGACSVVHRLSEPWIMDERQYSIIVELFGEASARENQPALAGNEGPSSRLPGGEMHQGIPLTVPLTITSNVAYSGPSVNTAATSPTLAAPPAVSVGIAGPGQNPGRSNSGHLAQSQGSNESEVLQNKRSGWILLAISLSISVLLFTGIVFRDPIYKQFAAANTTASKSANTPATKDTLPIVQPKPESATTVEVLLGRMNDARKLAIDAGAQASDLGDWKEAEQKYLQACRSDHDMRWADYVALCNQVCEAFHSAEMVAKSSSAYQAAANAFEVVKGFHLTGAPHQVPEPTKNRIASLEQEGIQAHLNKELDKSAKAYEEARKILIQADAQARVDEANELIKNKEPERAVRVLTVRVGEPDPAASVDSLFDSLVSSDKTLWLQCAWETIDQIKRIKPDEYRRLGVVYETDVARALRRLDRRDQLRQLTEELCVRMPQAEDYAENVPLLVQLMNDYTAGALESLAYLKDDSLASQYLTKLRGQSLLPPRYAAALSLGLGRVDDFCISFKSLSDARDPFLEFNATLELAARVMNDVTLLQGFTENREAMTQLRAFMSDVVLAEKGLKPSYYDPAELGRLPNQDDPHLMCVIRRIATHCKDKRYLEFMDGVVDKMPNDAANKNYYHLLSSLAKNSLVYRDQPSKANAINTLKARVAVVDEFLTLQDVSDQLASRPEIRSLHPHEITAMMFNIVDQDSIDLLSTLACVPDSKEMEKLSTLHMPAKLNGTKMAGVTLSKNDQRDSSFDLILREHASEKGVFDALIRKGATDKWQIALARTKYSSLIVEPTQYGNSNETIFNKPLYICFLSDGGLGFSFQNGKVPQVAKMSLPAKIDSQDAQAFFTATESIAYLHLFTSAGAVQKTKWENASVYFHSEFGDVPSAEAKKSPAPGKSMSDNATYYRESELAAKGFSKLIPNFNPAILPPNLKPDSRGAIRLYFGPQGAHKEFAQMLAFADEEVGQSPYSVAFQHKFNTDRGLSNVLICIDPTVMKPEQRSAVLERCFLKALGLGIYGKPIFQIKSSLCEDSKSIPSTGITDLDKRFIRGLYSLPRDADDSRIRQSYTTQMSLPLPEEAARK